MATTFKEFFSGTLTSADLTGTNNDEWLLISNDANTQAMVKDIIVDFANSRTEEDLSLLNNDFNIGTLQNLSGSELIAANNTLKCKLPKVPVAGSYTEFSLDLLHPSSHLVNSKSFLLSGNNYDIKASSKKNNNYGSQAHYFSQNAINPIWFHIEPSTGYWYYFSYDGNSNTNLYKSTNNGASWTTVLNQNYGYLTLDKENSRIYYQQSRTIYYYDLLTDAPQTMVGTSSLVPGAVSSYSRTKLFDNKLFISIPTTSSSQLYCVDLDTNTVKTIVFPSDIGLYNSYSDYYIKKVGSVYYIYIIDGSSKTIKTYTVTSNLTSSNTASMPNTLSITDISSSSSYNRVKLFSSPDGKYMGYIGDSSTLHILSIDPYPTEVLVRTGFPYFVTGINSVTDIPLSITDLDLYLKIKVSGLEIGV